MPSETVPDPPDAEPKVSTLVPALTLPETVKPLVGIETTEANVVFTAPPLSHVNCSPLMFVMIPEPAEKKDKGATV